MSAPPPTAAASTTHLLYLHGFRSSPQSAKARQVAARVRARNPQLVFWCPQLPPSPDHSHKGVVKVIMPIPGD